MRFLQRSVFAYLFLLTRAFFFFLKKLGDLSGMLKGGWPWVAGKQCENWKGNDATGFC
jgi:hypothetical protein